MKKHSFLKFFIFLTVLFFYSCERKLERENVEIAWGIRLDDYSKENYSQIQKDISQFDAKTLWIEIPVSQAKNSDSIFVPIIDSIFLIRLQNAINFFPKSLTLNLSFVQKEGINFHIGNAEIWLQNYSVLLEKTIKNFGQKSDWISLATDFAQTENLHFQWKKIFSSIKKSTKAKIFYTARLTQISKLELWENSDAIGVSYEYVHNEKWKPFARKWNKKASEIAVNYKIPILISQANIISEDKVLQFKNELRFWDKDLKLVQICFNNISQKTVLSEEITPFSLKEEKEFYEFLKKYSD